jgi:mandelate racemase
VVAESPLVLTDVLMDDGTVGHSIVFTYTPAALKPTADLIRNLEELIRGDELAPLAVEQKLATRFRLLGTQGLVGMALAGIDMALWDALARSRGVSVTQVLGGAPRPIPAYGGLGFDGPEVCAREAVEWIERGFTGVKAKIGYPTVCEDVAVIRAIRKAVGDGIAVMVDYNQCLSPADAVQRMRALDDEGLTWVEEPTLAHDFAGNALIAREAKTAIQCGENWWGTLDLRHAIDAGSSDYVMPDLMKVGGISAWMRAAGMAHAAGLRMSNHFWPEVSTQMLCVTPTGHWLEYVDWWNPIVKEPLQVIDGLARVEGVIGSGVEWNEAAVERFAV